MEARRTFRRAAPLVLGALLAGCAAARVSYTNPAGPRYGGGASTDSIDRGTLKVVSFNVRYAQHVDSAIRLLRETAALRGMDVLLLQEMDEAGTKTVARALGMEYVYYPATVHPATHRDFGNAILSRYPIDDDHKVVLPHFARLRHTPRVAVAATIIVGTRRIRVYSVHIATMANNGPAARREQLAAVLTDADSTETVIIGGDFNSETVPEIALARGYTWPTRHIGRTISLWSLDHVLLKGVAIAGDSAMGSVHDRHGASDHRPIWIRVALPALIPAR
jgi:endonuclease/exonuclease/phosphatase family metal-dependent hydrolase